MNWEQKAVEACLEKGLKVVPYGFEGGYVFVENNLGEVFPLFEETVAKWINGDA